MRGGQRLLDCKGGGSLNKGGAWERGGAAEGFGHGGGGGGGRGGGGGGGGGYPQEEGSWVWWGIGRDRGVWGVGSGSTVWGAGGLNRGGDRGAGGADGVWGFLPLRGGIKKGRDKYSWDASVIKEKKYINNNNVLL